VGLAVAYFLWPADLVPEFVIPLAGYLDDVMAVWLATRWLVKSAPPEVKVVPNDPPRKLGQ
jgi:uncharacterized membrane protein YkvA (DUF1232 family)